MIYVVVHTTPKGRKAFIGGRFTAKYIADIYRENILHRWPTAEVMPFKNLTEAAAWRDAANAE